MRGEGNLVVFAGAVAEDEDVDGEGDKYLDETCLPLGFLATTPLSLRGSLVDDPVGFSKWAFCSSCRCCAGDCREGVSGRENAATIIRKGEKSAPSSTFREEH
ncbi:hypothetical protein SLE2022_259400 [Rubroshorea leprosula]